MKKNLFSLWVFLFAVFCVTNVNAQATIGNTNGKAKAAEAFSALEVVSNGKGGLRLPQLTTEQRNTLALANVTDPIKRPLASGLSIFNTTTNCVEYWSGSRWISLCDGTSQTTVGPAPCTNVSPDGTGCDNTFSITDPDCPNGPFQIAIIAGNDFASLSNVDERDGTYKLNFSVNESVASRSVLVRVTSTCTSQYKDFIYMQDGVTCTPMGPAPAVSPSEPSQNLCSGGAVYLSVPASTPNLDKLIWTRNGIEVARGVSYYIATLKGTYNVSLGAAGCNVSSSNVRVLSDSNTAAPAAITTLIASNNGVVCGASNSITLTLAGGSGTVSWFRNGILQTGKSSSSITVSGSEAGDWFAAAGSGGCFSKPSNTVPVSVNTASGSITVSDADILVNGKPIKSFTSFCAGGSLTFKVNNPQSGVSYTWYNGQDVISSPYIVPAQGNMMLRMVASDISGAKCPAESSTSSVPVTMGATPGAPTINGTGVVCDGTADLSITPAQAGTYTYQWYKDGVLLPDTTQTISAAEPGTVYSATVTTTSGCVSPYATKTIASEVSSLPVVSWVSPKTTAYFGDKVTFEVDVTHGPATYTWTVDGGATTLGTGKNCTITFPTTGADGTMINLKVVANNACGQSVELPLAVRLSAACPTPVVTAGSATAFNTSANTGITAKVNVTQANGATYQWYKSATPDTTAGASIAGATAASYLYTPTQTGITYIYCIVKNGCDGTPAAATTPIFTVTASADPVTIPTGTGTFGGKTCFDIAESNDGGTCGLLTSRLNNKSDFNLVSVNKQTYTFTPSGTVSRVRFMYIESATGTIIESLTSSVAESALNISTPVTATIAYKSNLSSPAGAPGTGTAFGKTATNPLSVDIFVVYNTKADGSGTDVKLKLTSQIKDCSCCGAYISPTVFKEFMCFNLGANPSYDPFVPNPEIVGDWYQWGKSTPAVKASVPANPPTGAIITWSNSYTGGQYDWGGNVTGVVKGSQDPCPTGYRIPSINEWNGVIANNQKTILNSGASFTLMTSGVKMGNFLMLPYASYRTLDGALPSIYNAFGMYFGTNTTATNTTATVRIETNGGVWTSTSATMVASIIRCISDN